jgi:hypothetical protein
MAVGGIHGVILVLNTLKRLVVELTRVNCVILRYIWGSRYRHLKRFNLVLFTSITHVRVQVHDINFLY